MHGTQSGPVSSSAQNKPFRVAIVGGGPGGLFTAWHLATKAGTTCDITIYEASDRVGGKILTREFPGAGLYEAGVAEIYDYSSLGPDPLRELIETHLKLPIKHIAGGACILGSEILPDTDALASKFGLRARNEAKAFRQRCADLLSPTAFYKSERMGDNAHPWAQSVAEDLLTREISDPAARQYIRVMSHSDVAAPPHLTNGLNFLKNVLMDVDGYINVFSVVGGNEEIVHRLADHLDVNVRLNSPVQFIDPQHDGTHRLGIVIDGMWEEVVADFVIVALPLTSLSIMDWRSPGLRKAVFNHINYFDRPGHYLRATLLFKHPFWRNLVPGAWWMMDAFDGCCVYDEGARHDLGPRGALGFLISGNAALALANLTDTRVEELCLDALSAVFKEGRSQFIESRVHRWMASVNAIPGGYPVRARRTNHQPDPLQTPGVYLVGDYIFDATLNGVLDSADTATDMLVGEILRRDALNETMASAAWSKLNRNTVHESYFGAPFIADMLRLVWDIGPGASVLVAGPGSGLLVEALRQLKFNAWGIDSDRRAFMRSPKAIRKYDQLGELTDIPFANRQFDIVIETGLCRLTPDEVPGAIRELRRVTRRGVILGSATTDLPVDLITRYQLLSGVKTMGARWDWADHFFAEGFRHVLWEPARLAKVWERAKAEGAGPGRWYEDAEAMLYSFYEPNDAAARIAAVNTDVMTNFVIPFDGRVPVADPAKSVSNA